MSVPSLDNKRLADQGAAAEGRGDCARAIEGCGGGDCRWRSLVIRCGHGQRAYKLDLLAPVDAGDVPVLQVISRSDRPDVITIAGSGSCVHGHSPVPAARDGNQTRRGQEPGGCPVVRLRGPGVQLQQTGTFDVGVYPHASEIGEKSFSGFFERIFLGTLESNDYELTTHYCRGGGGPRARIEAYGELEWRIHLRACWPAEAAAAGEDAPAKPQPFLLAYDIDVTRDGEHWHLVRRLAMAAPGSSNPAPTPPPQPAFPVLRENDLVRLFWLFKVLAGAVERNRWQTPDIHLDGNFHLQELAGDFRVRQVYELRLRCAPLLSAQCTVDLVPVINMLLPGKAAFLDLLSRELIKSAGRQIDAYADPQIRLLLTASGDIGGNLTWSRGSEDSAVQCDGRVEGRVGFSLEPQLAVEGAILVVTVKAFLSLPFKSADAEAGVSAVAANWSAVAADGNPALAGNLSFNGLAWYGAAYFRFGVEQVADRQVTASPVGRLVHRVLYALSKGGSELRKEVKFCEIFAPFRYPAGEREVPLGDFVGSGDKA